MYWNKSFLFFRCKVRFCSGILCLVILCIMSCGTEKYVQFVYADLRAFGEQKSASELQFEAFEAGGGGLKREQSIVWHEVTCSWTTSGNDACLEVNVPDSSGYLEGSVKALNLPENRKGFDEISLQAENPN